MSSSVWQNAVMEDGTEVMYEVTRKLYPGNIPPQSIVRKEVYYKVFDSHQRNILESWKPSGYFEISTLAAEFDISLHYAVQKSVCGLKNHEDLYRNVRSLVEKRNAIAHSPYNFQEPADDELAENLDDLLNLYMEIFENLEDCTGQNLYAQKEKIRRSVQHKKGKLSEMSNLDKLAVGVGVAGVVGLGLGALMGALIPKPEKKEKK